MLLIYMFNFGNHLNRCSNFRLRKSYIYHNIMYRSSFKTKLFNDGVILYICFICILTCYIF